MRGSSSVREGSRVDQFLQFSHADLANYVEFEASFFPCLDPAGQIASNVFQTDTRQSKLSFFNFFI